MARQMREGSRSNTKQNAPEIFREVRMPRFVASFHLASPTPRRIQQVKPPILGSSTIDYGADYRTFKWVYLFDPP